MNYQNGKIYWIRSNQTDKVYIGSTTTTLAKRMSSHKISYRNSYKRQCKANEILQYEDAYIELLEPYPCNTKEELLRKEGEYIRELDCVNRCVAGRTAKEYVKDNKEIINKKRMIHYHKNRDKLLDMKRQKYDQINETRRKHYAKNKDEINQKVREKRRAQPKVECELCGMMYSKPNRSHHMKSRHSNN